MANELAPHVEEGVFLCDNSGVVAAIQKGSSIESLVVCACSDHCGSLWHVLMFCLVLGIFLGYLLKYWRSALKKYLTHRQSCYAHVGVSISGASED